MYSKKYILLFMISYIKVVICSKFPTFVVESTTPAPQSTTQAAL